MFVQVLKPLFTIPPAGLAISGRRARAVDHTGTRWCGTVDAGIGRILRHLNPAELLREE